MMLKGREKSKINGYFVFLILIFNICSIFLLPDNGFDEVSHDNLDKNPESRINLSNDPPNKNLFKYYKEIIIHHSKISGSQPLNNFPVLVSIFDSELHENVQSSGNDIAFSDGIVWLDHEIELFELDYNTTHAKLVVWVRIPFLSTSIDTTIYLFYGNTTMSSRENPTGVWDTNYKGVWHLSEDPSGTIYDSTSNDNDGTPEGSLSSADQIDGQIDGSLNFDGDDEYIDCGNPPELQITGSITVEAWFKADYFGNTYLISKNGPSGQRSWDISFDDINLTHGYLIYRYALNGNRHADDVGNVTIPINQWHHVVGVFEPSTYSRMFLNGQMVDENTTNIISSQYDAPNNLRFAARGDNPPPNYFNGTIDEVRISNIARSADWIKTGYNNQFDPSSFYSIGKGNKVSDQPHDAHSFLYYKEITIDHTMVSGPDDLLNFPVLISTFDKDLHDKVQPDGDDIAFSKGLSWLDHEIELFNQTCNSTHAQLVAWVRIPKLSTSVDTIIRMYYGNSTMGSRENPEGVWESNYKGVWHLSEDPTDPSPEFKDSTPNNNDGTDYGSMTSGDQVAGQIHGSLDFDGNDDYLEVNDSSSLTIPGSFTISAWINTNDLPPAGDLRSVVGKGMSSDNPGENHNYGIMLENAILTAGQAIEVYYEPSTGFSNVVAASWVTSLNLGQWYHVVGVHDAGANTLTLFVNGVQRAQNTGATATPDTGNAPLRIADVNVDIYPNEFNGQIDEVRVLDTVRSTAWLSTEFNNQDNPNSFYSIGKEYTVSGNPPSEHYFKSFKDLTISHTMVSGSDDLLNFPFLISIFDKDLQNDVKQSNGNDIAFSFNGAWLDHEIELFNQAYNGTHSQLITWVSIPRLSTSEDTTIRMYYGNSTMSSRQNPSEVWYSNYKGVWHLRENPSGAAPQMKDSTSNNNDGTCYYLDSGDQKTGQIDGSIEFNDVDDNYVNYGTDSSLNMGSGDFSLSLWFNYPLGDHNGPIAGKGAYGSGGKRYFIAFENDQMKGEIDDDNVAKVTINSPDVDDGLWHYALLVREGNNLRLYLDGVEVTGSPADITGYGSLDMDLPFYMNTLANNPSGTISDWSSVKMDEVRIANIAHSRDWIVTEYNNQYNPQSFLTIGEEVSFDVTPPTYSNLIESADPLELGETEVITINVSDPSEINQVKIEFEAANHTMTNIGGDTWQYGSWTPGSVDNYSYTIWMEDNFNNWNSTTGNIEVLDTTAPTYSDLIESADQLQLGQNETINIKVYDSPGSGVNQVLLEYGSSNHTMDFIGGNSWSWSEWKPVSLGIHPYTIYMQDMEDNWNMTSGTITVVSTTAPVIENVTESEDPLELGKIITIRVDVFDNESYVKAVLIEIDGNNHTMTNTTIGNTYEYNWTRSYVGTIYYTIYANDTANNWNSYSDSFNIVDTTPPTFSDLIKSDDTLELGDTIVISINSTDLADVVQVDIEFQDFDSIIRNHTMSNIIGDIWQYHLWSPSMTGNWSYTIWAEDNNTNKASFSDSILVRDTILPKYSDLTESESIVELGDQLTISINASDLAGIKDVSIEFENANHSMTYLGELWQHNSWRPKSIGNYTYKIYITDNNDNLNYTSGSILFQDTVLPVPSNLYESADPLELGDTPIIRIDIYDFAGISQSLIEFEGANHSMTNIYGETWQYDLWTPSNWIIHQYKIHMEDSSGNWNFIMANITVQDTTPPTAPALTNSPSGDVSGLLVFDWLDGSDPSGIAYYILIIDNETDPLATPGYVCFFNISNIDSQSSYFELSENLIEGRYYYFLSQIDGVGHQSTYTMGTFNVVAITDNNLMIYIIIGIVMVSVGGLVGTAVIVRKKTKKEILPHRKIIPLKIISSHINKLFNAKPTLQVDDKQDQSLLSKKLPDEIEIQNRVNSIKSLGEELFAEGAYLEAQKQFKLGRELLLNLGREEDAQLFSELISGIDGLIVEREKRLEILEQTRIEGNSNQIFDLYQEIIDISNSLRDPDAVSYYRLELIQFFQNNNLLLVELEIYRLELNQKAELAYNSNNFEMAAQLYEKCEKISQLLVQLGREDEVAKIEEFRSKKIECQKRIS